MLFWGGGKTEKLKNDELGIIHHKCLFGVEGRLKNGKMMNVASYTTNVCFLNGVEGRLKLNKWPRDKCPKSGVEGGSTI